VAPPPRVAQAYKEVVAILEAAGATEDAQATRTIHSGATGGAAGEKQAAAGGARAARPASALPKPRPVSASRTAADVARLAAGLFGVFRRPRLAREVRKSPPTPPPARRPSTCRQL
jgi:hypothetical protein